MAKVEGPLYSMAASGKQSALVYARNPYGPYTRAAPGAALSPTGEQTAWQDAMTAVYTTWETDAGITPGRRAQWMDFARAWPVRDRWGREVYLDAFRWFTKFGIHRQRKGLGLHLGPPISPACEYYPTLTFTQRAWGIEVDADPRPTGDEMICLSIVSAQSTNRNFCPRKRTYVDHLMTGNSWPYVVWLNGDLDVAEKRYFFVYRVIDGAGRPSSQQIEYVDCARWTAPWTAVADADTFLFQDGPDNNFGGDFYSIVRNHAADGARLLTSFDLSGIPTAAVVATATANFWCYWRGGNEDISDHKGLTEWEEMEATWNESETGVNWSVAGGQAGVDYVAVGEDSVLVDGIDQFFSWDCAVMAGEWVGTPAGNYGMWLIEDAPGVRIQFRTREWGTVAQRPYISIVFGS